MDNLEWEKCVLELMVDKDARDLMIQKLREGGHVAATSSIMGMLFLPTPSGSAADIGTWSAMSM